MIFSPGELDKDSICSKNEHIGKNGKITHLSSITSAPSTRLKKKTEQNPVLWTPLIGQGLREEGFRLPLEGKIKIGESPSVCHFVGLAPMDTAVGVDQGIAEILAIDVVQ